MTVLILVCAIAIVASALCSLCEAVLYSVPISQIEGMAQAGEPAGRILKKLRDEIDRPIAAILTLNTISNTAGAAIAGSAAAAIWGHVSVGYFSVLFTLAILIFSEVIPKTIGVAYSQRLAGFVALTLQWMVNLLMPMVWLCNLVTRLVARDKAKSAVSAEDIVIMARLGRIAGEIGRDEEKVIKNILSLKKKTARDVMTPRTVMFSFNEDLTVQEIQQHAGIWPHSRIPVYSENPDDIVGVVLRRDVFEALAEDKHDIRLNDLMHSAHFCPASLNLDKLLLDFLEQKQHLFIVIDEFGGVAGIVTLEDVLEEILGKEIVDESDQVVDMRELARRRKGELQLRQK
ncbi:MAG: hemolysin family protein [Pseudomonadota bacterium]